MLHDDPLWYKDSIIYEVHVRAFHDSAGNGMGDFRGLTQKLDYLQDLGVTAIWILPFYPSPLRDDGYDIADYTGIHTNYGSLADFEEFLEAAHARGVRVITELVINHTSDQHPWFQRARRAPPGSVERDFYVWSDSPEKYQDARIIFKDFEHSNWSWDPVAHSYYWHRFYSHQPDLNYDNPAVWEALTPAIDFWLSRGVDGMRLDAVPYLFEREGTSCENLPETHAFLKAMRAHIDARYDNRMLLAEANQWPEDAVAYFGDGDEAHMAFHFPLMPRMFMAIHMEDRFPIIDILAQTPAIPDNCQWCQFLRNHDELTLEMVTDEERDYMYRAYASDPTARINLGIRRRLAPLLSNNRRRIELMNGLLFSLPGAPVIYYGDEIGMGDNIYLGDRNGVRTPMQWSSDRNAGFSRANPQRLFLPVIIDPEYHYEAINVETQQNNPHSLLWWTKRLIALRKQFKAFSRGTLEFLQPTNRKVLAFFRRYEGETLLVVANLSRFVQHVELDLASAAGCTPVELFGRTALPVIGPNFYALSLGPHDFFWFELRPQAQHALMQPAGDEDEAPAIVVPPQGLGNLDAGSRQRLMAAVRDYLQRTNWVSSPREIKQVNLLDAAPLRTASHALYIALLSVDYSEGMTQMYHLPVAVLSDEAYQKLREAQPLRAIARLTGGVDGWMIDAMRCSACIDEFVRAIVANPLPSQRGGEMRSVLYESPSMLLPADVGPPATILEGQANATAVVGESLVFKALRRVEEGLHPEQEIGYYLTQRAKFMYAPPLVGTVEFRRRGSPPLTVGVMHRHIPNEGTAWQYTLDELSLFYERVVATSTDETADAEPTAERIEAMIGGYGDAVRLLAERTADLHRALTDVSGDLTFAPESFSPMYQRALYQSMRNLHRQTLDRLARSLPSLPEDLQSVSQQVLDAGGELLGRFRMLYGRPLGHKRIRCHGNLGLIDTLRAGKEFVFIDFEGEESRSLAERRIKRSALRDVASMLRSFHYAAVDALMDEVNPRGHAPGMIREVDLEALRPWAWRWYTWVGRCYAETYREATRGNLFSPSSDEEFQQMLEVFLLEAALRELQDEIPLGRQRMRVPLRAILSLLGRD
jgi:maltose alpha-D-glucosyltransferase/alpha-amylase